MSRKGAIAITMGEPAGIGGELILKAWLERGSSVPFFAIDDADRLGALAQRLGWSVPIQPISTPGEALRVFSHALPVLHRPLAVSVQPGHPDPANVPAVTAAIELAVDLCLNGQARAMVTLPIHKHVMHQGGFGFDGHTDFLAHVLAAKTLPGAPVHREVMMLACPGLRVVPVTIHQGLAQAVANLNADDIIAVASITARALQTDFGIHAPRLAIAALNPHAGEDGDMGREEIDMIAPAISALKQQGIDASGPHPSDTLFHVRARQTYDAAICMYHDQALIPLKTIDFDAGVNITLGLPIVRTSPDHGTAFDLAGTGQAHVTSLMEAIAQADRIASHREH